MTHIFFNSGREFPLTGSHMFAKGNKLSFEEIAFSLAQINRFTGHCSRPYSVAEHSLLVAGTALRVFNAPTIVQLAALMHDAHECICGDASSPVKEMLGDSWAHFESTHQTAVLMHHNLHIVFEKNRDMIRQCDLIALATERRDLLPFDPAIHAPWPILDTPGQTVQPLAINLNQPVLRDKTWAAWARLFVDHADLLTLRSIQGTTT